MRAICLFFVALSWFDATRVVDAEDIIRKGKSGTLVEKKGDGCL